MGNSAPSVRSLICPNCGGTVTLRGFGQTLTVVCVNCLTVLDTKTPSLRVLQQFQAKERVIPLIPLGARGKLHGDPYEVLGFQVRQIMVELIPYEWREYLLFNPYKGFRYLTEYDGHWNDVKPIKGIPSSAKSGSKRAIKWLGEVYTHFQSAMAETTYVLGEFPWRVEVGERARTEDFISPPRILSSETTEGETVWSLGEYMTGARVWEIFQLPGGPPQAKGIFANQPSPYKERMWSTWKLCLWLLAGLFTVMLLCSVLMRQREVFRQTYSYSTLRKGEASFVTGVFELQGRPSTVEISIRTNLDNDWAYYSLALISEATGQAYDLGREVSYYHGRDSDGDWTEGSRNDSALIPSVPSGRYYLRVEPEMDPNPPRGGGSHSVNYELTVRRDVPANSLFLIAALLLLIPPVWVTFRRVKFETARWQESDYATSDDDE
jgi:hypothetical protein